MWVDPMNKNGKLAPLRYAVSKEVAKVRQAESAPLEFFRRFPQILVIGLNTTSKEMDFCAPGFGPDDGARIAAVLREIAHGIEEDIEDERFRQDAVAATSLERDIEHLKATAKFKPGDRVKLEIWHRGDYKDLVGCSGVILMISDAQRDLDHVAYDVDMGGKVASLIELDLTKVVPQNDEPGNTETGASSGDEAKESATDGTGTDG